MRTVRNITVAVEPELYRQTRKIAADYDSTFTDMVQSLPEKIEILPCAPVNASQPLSLHPLARQQPAPIQDKHSSISTLKSIISKALISIL
jgi:hypothetical protein